MFEYILRSLSNVFTDYFIPGLERKIYVSQINILSYFVVYVVDICICIIL